MASEPTTSKPSATEMARAMRERNKHSRARVLRSIERLREIADAKRRHR